MPRKYEGCNRIYIDRLWCRFESVLASYCSRVLFNRGESFDDVANEMKQIIEPQLLEEALRQSLAEEDDVGLDQPAVPGVERVPAVARRRSTNLVR